jgi:hypothetical protein
MTVFTDSARVLTLRVSGLPRRLTATLAPRRLNAHRASTLTLRTAATTPPGVYRIEVSARGRATRRAFIKLTVRRHAVRLARAPLASSATAWPVKTHVPTWAFDDGCNGGSGASVSLVRGWLSYAESNCGAVGPDGKALTDCHAAGVTYCQAIQYLNANEIYGKGSVPIAADAQENWWLHRPRTSDSAGRLVKNGASWGHAYELDGSNHAVDAWFQNYVRGGFSSFDGLMMDDVAGSTDAQFYGTQASSSDEISSDGGVLAEHERMAAAMTRADGSSFLQIDNGINVNPYLPTTLPLLGDPSSVQGLIAEGDPISDGTVTSYYSTLLDDMSYVDATSNDFLVLLSYDQNGSLQARRVQAATVLLGYSPGHTVSWSDLEQNSNDLAVWPEQGIVPTEPVQSMAAPGGSGCLTGGGQVCSSGGHNDVQVASGVYRREFKSCYDQGVGFGACAAVMNDTANPVTVQGSWLTQSYSHQITMNGGDVQSGGTVELTGTGFTPGATTIPPHDAVLLSS